MSTSARVMPRAAGDGFPTSWTLPEEPVPESVLHASAVDLLNAILSHWVATASVDALVGRNLAVRWVGRAPRIGLDPDLCLVVPRPPGAEALDSLRTWVPEQHPPALAIEVVSKNHPYKDYVEAPVRYASARVGELWVFDPLLVGPRALGGPVRLQVWTRAADGTLVRCHAGEGPAFSPTLGAWAHVVEGGSRLRIAEDEAGERPWPTAEEAALAAKDAALAAKDAALARVAELEAELARRR